MSSRSLDGLTYQLMIDDHTLDENNLQRDCPLDYGRHQVDPRFDLGTLDQLPIEVLMNILDRLDIRSLTDFRRLNQRAMQIVDCIPSYATILKYCPMLVRGVLSIEIGSDVFCRTLYLALTTSKCENCADFGGYIYLPTCSRICHFCLKTDPKYLPISINEAARRFGLGRKRASRLPHLKTLPGVYSPLSITWNTRTVLVDLMLARSAGIELHGSVQSMEQCVEEAEMKRDEAYNRRLAQVSDGVRATVPRKPSVMIPWDGQEGNKMRYVASVRAPYLDVRTKHLELGFHCKGCTGKYESRWLHCRRKYTVATMEEHIQECGDIQGEDHRPR